MSDNEVVEAVNAVHAAIDALKTRGAHCFEPVQFRFIETLARRAAQQPGLTRRLLDAKLLRLLAAHGEAFAQAGPAVSPPVATTRGPLAELVDQLARHAQLEPDGSPTELKTLRHFRSTWSRLSADRRLTQSLAKVPNNAGPLNSQHLVHQALSVMRELSPAYLERFMSHVDALLWLDQVNSGSALPGAETARAEGRKRPARPRSA